MARETSSDLLKSSFQSPEENSVKQVAEILSKKSPDLHIRVSGSGRSFESTKKDATRDGVISVKGELKEDGSISLKLELARLPTGTKAPVAELFGRLSSQDKRCHILTPTLDIGQKEEGLWIELPCSAGFMSMARQSALLHELDGLDDLAKALQAEMPSVRRQEDLIALYEPVSDWLIPVMPCGEDDVLKHPALIAWARSVLEYLYGCAVVAVETSAPSVERFILALLAHSAQQANKSLGILKPSFANGKIIIEACERAPGIVGVPAVRMGLGTNVYELNHEMDALLATLAAKNHAVVFVGTQQDLQSTFGGGQGGVSDPLRPIVCHAPEVPLDALVNQAVQSAIDSSGKVTAKARNTIVAAVMAASENLPGCTQRRVLPQLVARAISASCAGPELTVVDLSQYARILSGLQETLTGLSTKPRQTRSPEVRERYRNAFLDPCMLDRLREELVGQDDALEELVLRMQTECLTRPLHQPFRYVAQGTPGTGKSQSAMLLAQKAGIPYMYIDAASMSDYYSAASQLLGSSRGIVGSHQSGRLEQASKSHQGALIEVADLDHAVPSVRSGLADLFLQILETGEGQSATGAIFSCANMILVFTLNLPGGADEAVRKGIGFAHSTNRREVVLKVEDEIKQMLSSAFLSRIGQPILFDPLDEQALSLILVRAITSALRSFVDSELINVTVNPDVAPQIMASMDASVEAFGARRLLDHGRALAAVACLGLLRSGIAYAHRDLYVSVKPDNTLSLEPL